MAGINDYSNTPSLNTTINTIDVDEGCNPANINDAIRQLMADIADVDDGVVPLQTPDINGGTIDGASLGASSPITSATISGDLTVDTNTLYVDSTNNRVGIGTTSPVAKLNIQATAATSGEDLIKLINGTDAAELVIDTSANAVNFNLGASDVLKVIGGSGASGSTIPSPGTFVVENNNDASIAVLTPDAYTSYIRLGHTSDPSACKWSFDPSTDAMEIGTTTTSGYVTFLSGNATEAMRIDSSGNVGIGETNPSAKLTVNTNLTITNSSGNNLKFIGTNSGSTGGIDFQNDTTSVALIRAAGGSGAITLDADASNTQSDTYIAFDVDGSEAGRINASGNLLFGDTSATNNTPKMDVISASGQVAMTVYRKTISGSATLQNWRSDVTTTSDLKAEVEGNGDLVNDTGSYTAFSDINLKQDIVDARSQWEDIKALQVKNFKLKKYVSAYGEDAPIHLGVIAQEVEASGMNGLVSENEDGTKYVKYSILYMKAVKALQEAITRIESLETENTSIKARLDALEQGA